MARDKFDLKVGDRVECIDEWDNSATISNYLLPQKGQIYTIRKIEYEVGLDAYGILLEEIHNPVDTILNKEIPFLIYLVGANYWSFKKVVKPKRYF